MGTAPIIAHREDNSVNNRSSPFGILPPPKGGGGGAKFANFPKGSR